MKKSTKKYAAHIYPNLVGETMMVKGRKKEVDQVALILKSFFDNPKGFSGWIRDGNPYELVMPLAEWVEENVSLSDTEQQDVQFYQQAFKSHIKPKHLEKPPKYKSHRSDKVGKIVLLLLELLKNPLDEIFKLGRFAIRTKGNPDTAQVLKCIKELSQLPFFEDFKKTLYGDILISEEDDVIWDRKMESNSWAAFFDSKKDIIRIRTSYTKLCNKQMLRILIHELAHRFWRKIMNTGQKMAWGKYDEQIRQQGGALELDVGDKLNNLFILVDSKGGYSMGENPSSDEKAVRLKVSEVVGDQFWVTIDNEEYQPIDPMVDMQLRIITNINSRAFGPFKVSEYGRVEDGHFPSIYAQTNKEEHFCEAIAFYYLGALGEEATMQLKKALNYNMVPGNTRKVIASSQASWSILSEGVSASRVEAHIVRSHVNQMIEAIKKHPQIAEEIFKRCGDNFEAIPKHMSKMERHLDRTNYALITMGGDWYRQRLTHEDREMVDMAAKYNPTPFPSTSKQSEIEMKKQAGSLKKLISEVIEIYEDELLELDDEYLGYGNSGISRMKEDSLFSGDLKTAISLTNDRRVQGVLENIRDDIKGIAMKKQAGFGRIIGNAIEDFRAELEMLDSEYIDGGDSWTAQDKQEALHSGEFEHAMSLTRNRRVKEVIMAIQDRVDNYSPSSSKYAAPKGTPAGVWEDFGDNRKLIKVRSVPSATNRNDQEKGDFSFNELTHEFVDAIAPKRSDIMGILKQLDTGLMEIFLFKLKADYTEIVEVSSGYPDGGATFYLWEVYFRPTKSKTLIFKANLRVESLVVAGGSFVDGTLLTESKAKNFISAAKRNRGEVY